MVKLLPNLTRSREQRKANLYKQVLRHQAKRGGELFGPIPEGHRREFFCLDDYTWVWHEEWTDENGKHRAITTRYDIRPQGILKSQGSNSYQLVDDAELESLYRAARMYRDQVYTDRLEVERRAGIWRTT